MKKLLLLSCFLNALAMLPASGKNIVLPDMLKGDIILQQQADAALWGKAAPSSRVKIETSWDGRTYEAVAGADSLWSVKVATPEAGYTPYSVTFSCGDEEVVLDNVLIGDVWFCGGQSNMEMPLKGMFGCYVEGAEEAIAMSGRNRGLRYVTVKRHKAGSSDKSYFTEGTWHASSPATAADVSATAFFFGEALNDALDIPIGLVCCSWSGSFLEDWMDSSLFAEYPDQKVFGAEFTKAPTNYYYGMLEPASNYTVKGMIWYQGESNVGSPDYAERLAAAVELWKNRFGLDRMPFYIVELAPYLYNNGYEDKCPYLREQQFKASRMIPDAGMVSTYDLAYDYETVMIHPARKKEVGRRLAYMALSKAYGYGNPAEGPVFKSMSVEGNDVIVRFDNAENGFRVAGPLKGFELAGKDRVFHAADAEVVMKFGRGPDGGFMVRVSSGSVPEPVAVRYCFRDFLVGNLYNVEGWPAVPFRSDNW